ncbi:MAG TPA: 6-carboxytetrahydropterin synthase [Tepidisphaeraceae bacterium]|jgi:6-pyruvoyl tetrahydropterin synthase/QueD family protein|nr:6-carboxytetrahydropterin synthase [Tepidisphaeraceae bacterium]
MFRLTREVRFAINPPPDDEPSAHKPSNSYGGYPSLRGFGIFLTLQITVEGEPDGQSNYLLNIKEIDAVVRRDAIPFLTAIVRGVGNVGSANRAKPSRRFGSAQHSAQLAEARSAEPNLREEKRSAEPNLQAPGGAGVDVASRTPEQTLSPLFDRLRDAWPRVRVREIRLALSPFLSHSAVASELPMVRLSQKFEFSATHRLHNPALSDEDNRQTFGKCNNPHGHGHNYELQVTLRGAPNSNGVLIDVPDFERIVAVTVIDRFDHKNLNLELAEFRELIPTVENIAMVIYRLLKPALGLAGATLASVTVWETPKTWCEYGE